MAPIRSLTALEPGECGRLLSPAGGTDIPRRLRDLGFVPGTVIAVVRRAPLGDPVELELRGYRLCLRRTQLAGLVVRLEGPGA